MTARSWHHLPAAYPLCVLLATFAFGCGDDESGAASPTGVSTNVAPAPSGAWLRVANLSADLAGAEVRLDGVIFRDAITYPRVTGYRRVEAGSHRVRFIPSSKTPIDPRTVQLSLEVTVAEGQAVSIFSSGLVDTRTLTVTSFVDELATGGDGARVRLIHAMSDFPSSLALWLREGSPLVRNVGYLEDRGYRGVERGNYPLELRRQGTVGPLLPVVGYGVAGRATYTMFAYGTLRNGDLSALFVIDGSLAGPALR